MSAVEDKLNLTAVDFVAKNHGSIWLLETCNDAASLWAAEHLYGPDGESPMLWGCDIVVEHRFITDILHGIRRDGLDVEVL